MTTFWQMSQNIWENIINSKTNHASLRGHLNKTGQQLTILKDEVVQ